MHQDATWYGCRPQPRGLCVRWVPSPPAQKGGGAPKEKISAHVFLWPNGWMDQDATWHEGRPQPRRLCVRWGPSHSPQRGWSPLPNFRPISIVAKRMHQDATWYGGTPQPGDFVLDGDPASFPKRGRSPNFRPMSIVANGWMDQGGTCMEVGLGPSHTVLDGDPAPITKKGQSHPNFRPIFIVAKRLDAPRCHLVWISPGDFVLDRDPAAYPKRGEPPIFGPRLLWPNGCMDQDATWHGGGPRPTRPRPTRHFVRCGPSYPQKKGTTTPPNFWPMSSVAKRLDG